MMINQERIWKLLSAQGMLDEVIDLIREAAFGTALEDRACAYIIPTLAMCIDDNHGYLGSQPSNLAEMIEFLQNADEDERQ